MTGRRPWRIQPVARRTDPETSHEAAASVEDLTEKRRLVLTLLREIGPCTDEWLVFCYPQYFPEHRQSPSGIRTRRRELVDAGFARWTGEKVQGKTNRMMRVWEAL
jgi:hypothetical protein